MKYGYRARLHPAFFGIFAVALLYHWLVTIHWQDALRGIWVELANRPFGSEAARVYVQLVLALCAAVIGGIKDVRTDWAGLANGRNVLLLMIKMAIAIVLVEIAVDMIYQVVIQRQIHMRDMVLIILLFGLLPYFFLRAAISCLLVMFHTRR